MQNMNNATDTALQPRAGHAHPLLDTWRPGVGATLIVVTILLAGLS